MNKFLLTCFIILLVWNPASTLLSRLKTKRPMKLAGHRGTDIINNRSLWEGICWYQNYYHRVYANSYNAALDGKCILHENCRQDGHTGICSLWGWCQPSDYTGPVIGDSVPLTSCSTSRPLYT